MKSKGTNIKNLTEIKKYTNRTFSSILANAQLSNNYCTKIPSQIWLFNEVVNINGNLSKLKSIIGLEADANYNKEANFFLDTLIIDVKQNYSWKKKKKQASQTNIVKCAQFPNKIFNYIHVAHYQRLFFLVWYNDLIYTSSNNVFPTKKLLMLYYNRPNCNSIKPDYSQREPFINRTTPIITKIYWKWMACQILILRIWRIEIFTQF